MIARVLQIIFGALVDGVLKFLGERRHDAQLEQLGWRKGAEETGTIIEEISDAQREIDGRDRGGAGDVLERLRARTGEAGGADRKP